MKRSAILGLSVILLTVVLATFSYPQTPAAQGPQFKNKAEYDAYNGAYTEKAPAKKAELAEAFLNNFKESDISFRTNAYMMMVKGFLDAQNFPKAIDSAGKVAEALPNMPNERKATIYSYGMDAATKSDNIAKAIEFGDKVLAITEDANTLITLSGLIPERLPADEAGRMAALDKAEQYATRGLAVVGKIFAGPKPAAMSDADWTNQKNAVEAGLHANLGFIQLNRQDYDKAVTEYETVVKATPKDGVAQFRLGLSYSGQASAVGKSYLAAVDEVNNAIKATAPAEQIAELKAKSDSLGEAAAQKRDQAIETLATAVAIGGVVAQPARDQLVKLYQLKNGSTDGLEQLIQSKKPQ
jgi:tetratricopeptide (TPR) repeat protein